MCGQKNFRYVNLFGFFGLVVLLITIFASVMIFLGGSPATHLPFLFILLAVILHEVVIGAGILTWTRGLRKRRKKKVYYANRAADHSRLIERITANLPEDEILYLEALIEQSKCENDYSTGYD